MAARLAENLHAAVARLAVAAPFTEAGCVSVSIGVATARPDEPIQAAELLAHADAALYRAKEAGRNRVAAWQGVPLTLRSVHAH
jgi:diguanylate cyclase (GGDEF)-like protein